MRHIPEKRQDIKPPAGIAPLLLAVAFVLVLVAVVVGVATAA
ncbi:MAG TPA: hypothetical protein VK640_11340 [Actinomycetes bacterium]|nr:hypothetical protein [Actinomycetes bacterium]